MNIVYNLIKAKKLIVLYLMSAQPKNYIYNREPVLFMKKSICLFMIFIMIFSIFSTNALSVTEPGIPGSRAATATVGGNIKLSWSAVSGATGYVLYKSATRTGGFSRLKVTKATSFTTANELLFYKVRAYKSVNGKNIYGQPSAAFCTSEIPVTGLKSDMPGATLLRAWKISDKSTGTTVIVHKLAYGSPINTTYNNNKYGVNKSYQITQKCYLAIITCKPENFGSASALKTLNKTGLKKGEGLVNDIALRKNALVAVNNESFSGHWVSNVPSEFLGSGPVVKDGFVVQNKGGERNCATMYRDGTWIRSEALNAGNVNSKINAGLSFTELSWLTVWDGKPTATFAKETDLVGRTNGLRNQVMFGQIDSTHYLMMVGEWMQTKTMIDILLAYGVRNAFSCNGGNCTYMYLKGVGNVTGTIAPQLVNLNKLNVLEQEWLGKENYLHGGKGAACPAVDIVYAK